MKTSKLLITSLLAAAAMGANAFADTTTGTLLPALGDSITQIKTSAEQGTDWNQKIANSNIDGTAVKADLSASSLLNTAGWHWGMAQADKSDSDCSVSESGNGFTFKNRPAYNGEYVAATVDLTTLLGANAADMKTELSISFDISAANNLTASSFSIWSWDGSSDTATEIYKDTSAFTTTSRTVSVNTNPLLLGSGKLLVVWNASGGQGGSIVTVSNLASSYTTSTFSTLYWRGNAEGGTWSSSSTQWNSDSSATSGNASSAGGYDDVIFDSSATVAVDSAGVAVDTLTISAGTVSFSGGKVAAKSGFFVGNGGTLTLSSAKNLAGDVTVNAGGVFDLNGNADSVCYGEDTDGARLGTVYLNGGVLKDSLGNIDSLGNTTSIGRQLSKVVLTADSTVTAVTRHFGLAGAEWAPTELDLGGHTLTKDGAGTFLIITTTIKNGTLSVTEGKISDYNAGAVTLGANAVIDVKENGGVEYLTIASMAAGSALKLAGTTDNAVTLNNAVVGANAVVSVSGNSAVTGTITDLGNGAQLTLNGTNTSTLTLRHDRGDKTTNASIFIGSGSTFKDASEYKYHLELSGTLSGAGTLIAAVADNSNGQNDGWRKITLSGSTAGFTGVWELETAKGTATTVEGIDWRGHNRHVLGVLNSNDDIFGGVVKFTNNNADSAKVSSKLALLKDMTIGGLEGSLANTSVVGASAVGTGTKGDGPDNTTITTANRALTINVADGKSYEYAGKIDSTISLKKTGSGTQILSGDNSAYAGTTTLEAGTLGVGHANALGTSTVNVTGDAKLALGDRISITSLGITNNISIADSVKLTLGGGYAVELNGAITGSGTLRADMPWLTVALGGDNSGFSGAVEVVGTTVDAAHASALGTGILKISSADPLVGTERTSDTVQASAANVVLHDVSLLANNSAQLTAETDCSFTVAEGATLYLDIGALTDTVLTGDSVALTIAAASAFDNSFFSAVEVGTYGEDGSWVKDLQWAYVEGSWNVGAGTLSIAIPEPSMFGLLAGLGALALAGTRRRRRK